MNDEPLEIEWFCPECGCRNVDVKEWTATPTCFACDLEVEWGEIEESKDD